MTKKLLINFFRNKANGIDTDVKDFEKYFDAICYEYHKNISMLSNDLDECEDEYIAETIGDIPLILRKWQIQGLIVKKYRITEERINESVLRIIKKKLEIKTQ